MQQKIEEIKAQIELLKKELLALPSVQDQNSIDDLQAYIRVSTELLKAVAAFQVIKNVEEEQAKEEQPIPAEEPKPELGTLKSVINEPPAPTIEPELEPVEVEKKPQEQPVVQSTTKAAPQEQIEVAEMLANNAISDLRNAFGLNERFYYTNELFGGDGQEFVRAINEFNHLSSFDDAMRLIQAKYIPQFGWTADNEVAEEFVTIIKRRYS